MDGRCHRQQGLPTARRQARLRAASTSRWRLKGIPQTFVIIIFLIFFILTSYIPSIDDNATANDIQMGWLKRAFTRQNDAACVYIFRRQSASLSLGRAAA